ncbi:DinB family protein [Fodinicola feengrottensis]|uniref:DinB family protein n=1 Tax=Fodinicola feengrottensis TaxID=435914 RepID=A0ABP4TIZ2_9ACTN|nr:DinB family protein [Fodinicola feengrottensis]
MTIPPDTKNWTWVLGRDCPDCGFDTRDLPPTAVGQLLRDNATAWHTVLTASEKVRERPSPQVWSALEYGCHVRDVFGIFAGRLDLILTKDDPTFPDWDQDATAVEDRYEEQEPATVAADLVSNAEKLAAGFDAVTGPQWQRTCHRSDGSDFTTETFARYLAHDPVHHLYDVTGNRSLR